MNKKIAHNKTFKNPKISRKRQWGTEKEAIPLSSFHGKPSSRVIAFSRLSIVLTIVFWIMYVISVIIRQLIDGPKNYQFTLEAFGYLIIVTFLTFSALVYLIARQGALQRFSRHIRTPRALIDKYFSLHQPSITVLIPSYSEETQVIRKTMLSAALQEYPNIRVVLLVDDDPFKVSPENAKRLEETRALGSEIEKLLKEPYQIFSQALKDFKEKNRKSSGGDILEIASYYMWAADWLENLAKKESIEDHVDIFFTEQVLGELSKDLNLVGKALLASHKEGVQISNDRLLQLYSRLVWIFDAKMEIFERKRYISLSHDPNKAMNLNSYIGLMGGMYRQEKVSEGTILTPVSNREEAELVIPDSEFLLTLDADSILLKDYCLRLAYFLQQPDNRDVAVSQTPYSSFRGAPTRLERLSGATTDMQHIIHQGMSHYGATFWVGANAVIRKKALEDIVEKEWVGGFEIKRYIQDRTVIEDTESSIDLALKGWRLVNYPERLSYSATPPDFGSLIIQRRRWANGGLLILPKLLKLIRERKNKGKPLSKTEIIIRLNYMSSIAWSNLGLIFLLAYPYDGRLLSPLILLAAMPYFLAMAIDLKYCRYSYGDIVRIYGFNLILLPVNIAGTLKSIEQALTARKTPFNRTPKVKNRTAAGPPYLISPLLIVGFSIFTLWRNIKGENWGNAAFAGFNAFASSWAILSYIGIKNMIVDIWLGMVDMLYFNFSPKLSYQTVQSKSEFNWQGILYHGEANGGVVPREPFNEMISKRNVKLVKKPVEKNNPINFESRRKLSPWRVVLAFIILGIISYGVAFNLDKLRKQEIQFSTPDYHPWFASYVDVTATPSYAFEQLGSTGHSDVILSFIVASSTDSCVPTWGNYHTMSEAAISLDLDRRIARLQQQGGKIAASFGGALNSELSLSCTDNEKLLNAYKAVVERYNIDTMDLDLENQSLGDSEASERRAVVISRLQEEYRSEGKNLAIWLTLPVAPQGLTKQGTDVISKMLSKGVDISGVNLMIMDYGESREENQDMFEATKRALIETHRQLGILYTQAGINLNSNSLWRKIGATPMIGQNDFVNEIFTLEDAEKLNSFALSQGVSRMSMWSANRDIPCGENYVDVKVVSDSCSGVKTPKFGFAEALSKGFDGNLEQSAGILTTEDPESNFFVADDPGKSPYQIWKETGAYPKGVKVVWHGNVYEAKWWTKNDLPDNPVLQSWETPWQLIGPVLSNEKQIQQPTLPKGTYPEWSGKVVYDGGDRALFEGIPFQAKWWNQGESPAASAFNSDNSPWLPLTQAQIAEIIKEINKER